MCVGRKLLFNLASDRVDRGEHPVSSKMLPHPPTIDLQTALRCAGPQGGSPSGRKPCCGGRAVRD